MVSTTHIGECPEKTSRIIEVAQNRFGLYGFEKTTMNEIASDLNISKGSLYYYFPDKESLYIAVIQKEHDVFIHLVTEKIASLSDPAQMIREYVNIRLSYFHTLLNLSRFRHNNNMWELHSMMHQQWAVFKIQEEGLIADVLTYGVKEAFFEIENIHDIAELLLDIIKGLSMSLVKNKDIFYLEDTEYDKLFKKINLFVEMFIKSLKRQHIS
ncbi:TetR/AcrR family transcriptional regulator [uncultured Bacteroides sp.]|uniref:TetR/AcrR family transcriptional regulator n=1 Tax=uncultured Bacteroides sp. TaxID=162156 RepID=UPI002AA61BEF|nr:TetR/AcrR family transcriptional regulator [uncultured Bacteroides sp.]